MKVTIIQALLHWEDRNKNLDHLSELIDSVKEQTDLIILPEMFATGFTMQPEKNAEPVDGETLAWLKKKAAEKKCTITGSLAVEENGNFFNRLFWVTKDGEVQAYNKRHLFRMAKEDQHYTAGTEKIITQMGHFKICPLVCYDLRFPVWSRNRFSAETGWEYDVLLYVANWPEVRSYQWKQLLIARAIENQCFVIGVNRVGKDGNGFDHSGDSMLINPKGEILSEIAPYKEAVASFELDLAVLDEFRKIFPVGLDADNFKLE